MFSPRKLARNQVNKGDVFTFSSRAKRVRIINEEDDQVDVATNSPVHGYPNVRKDIEIDLQFVGCAIDNGCSSARSCTYGTP